MSQNYLWWHGGYEDLFAYSICLSTWPIRNLSMYKITCFNAKNIFLNVPEEVYVPPRLF